MSMYQDFFVFLADLFQQSDGALKPEEVKEQLENEGYGDVTAYDVREAVSLMYDEGDVFANNQSSVLEAYTGGNVVDQSFNAGDIGNVSTGAVNTGGAASSSAGSSSGGSSGGSHAPPATMPPPPAMDPMKGYTDLDAAVEQIVYVNNITNNITNIDDRDTFEDNDTVVDSSVNQTILANGNVTQDFDTVTVGDEGIGVGGDVTDANLVTGDNDGVIADNIAGSAVVGDNNDTTTLINSDGNVTGDVTGDGAAVTAFGGDNNGVNNTGSGEAEGIVDSTTGITGFGDGDVNNAPIIGSNVSESVVQTGGDGNTGNVQSNDDIDIVNDNDLIDFDDNDTTTTINDNDLIDFDDNDGFDFDDSGSLGGQGPVEAIPEKVALIEEDAMPDPAGA